MCYVLIDALMLAVVPVLFDYTLAPRKRVAKNLDVLVGAEAGFDMESSPTTVEVTLALRVLEGCCLVSSGCRATACDHSAVSVISSPAFKCQWGTLLSISCQHHILCTFSLLRSLITGTHWFLLSWKTRSTERLFRWITCCHARFVGQPEGTHCHSMAHQTWEQDKLHERVDLGLSPCFLVGAFLRVCYTHKNVCCYRSLNGYTDCAKLLRCSETIIWIPTFGESLKHPSPPFAFSLGTWLLTLLACRLKIAEFIVILISQVLPNTNTGFGIGEGSRTAWMTKWSQQELVEVLGEESREVIDSIIGAGRQKFCDQETQQSVTLGYARELLDLTSWLIYIVASNLYYTPHGLKISDANEEVGQFRRTRLLWSSTLLATLTMLDSRGSWTGFKVSGEGSLLIARSLDSLLVESSHTFASPVVELLVWPILRLWSFGAGMENLDSSKNVESWHNIFENLFDCWALNHNIQLWEIIFRNFPWICDQWLSSWWSSL